VGRRLADVGLEQAYLSMGLSRLRKGLIRTWALNGTGGRGTLLETVESLDRLLDLDLAIIQDACEDETKSRVRAQGASAPDQPTG